MRYLEWMWDPDPADSTYLVDYVYMLRGEDGQVRVEYDRHVEGIFSRNEWVEILRSAGFEASMVPFEHSDFDPCTHEVFLGVKRGV